MIRDFALDFTHDVVKFSGGFPQDHPKTLDLGQTRVRNAFNTLEIGGGGVGTPSPTSVDRRLGSVGPRRTLNRPNRRPTDMVSPYFEAAESISHVGLSHFLGFRPGSGNLQTWPKFQGQNPAWEGLSRAKDPGLELLDPESV